MHFTLAKYSQHRILQVFLLIVAIVGKRLLQEITVQNVEKILEAKNY